MIDVGRTAALFAALIVSAADVGRADTELPCPENLETAERFVLVLSPMMKTASAQVQLFDKSDTKTWKASGAPKAAVLGRNGLAWSWAHTQYMAAGEVVKTEGDGRTPAGFFLLGKPFGFSSGEPTPYLRLQTGEHYCVDDPRSPHYNAILPKAKAGAASGEDMATMPIYRQGLFVDYPTNASAQGGSCIFVHVWRDRSSSTAGCVALAEADVREMQTWSSRKTTVIGILPQAAWNRLRSCFPGI